MLLLILDILSWLLIITGSFFSVVGAVGLIRFPDFYTRIHAAGLTDTLGAWCILIGIAIQCNSFLILIKILLILFFIFFTSPTGTHALARAGLASNLKSWKKHKEV